MTEPGEREGSGERRDPALADVLDDLSPDGAGRSHRHDDPPPDEPPTQQPPDDQLPEEPPPDDQQSHQPPGEPLPDEQPEQPEPGPASEFPVGAGDEDPWQPPAEDGAAAVRPYAWTRGRTRPLHDFAVETLVSTSEHGHDVAALASAEHRAVAELCRSPRSVAEVAALLSLPLGVAKVLLADMSDIGLVVVHTTAGSPGGMPDQALMERVLSGLRRL